MNIVFLRFPTIYLFLNQITVFSSQIANRIALFEIKSLHVKLDQRNGSDCDLNLNRIAIKSKSRLGFGHH